MSKLLSANFMRVKKNKPFWGCIIFMLFLGISLPIAQYMQVEELNQTRQEVYETVLDQQFFTFVMFIGLVASVFCGLFLGTEYSDGTIRNKVVVGHTRNGIYLANLITCMIASLVMCLTFIISYLAVGYPLLGGFHLEIKQILLLTLASFMVAVVFSSIYTLIAMNNQNKAAIAVACVLFAFISMFGGQLIESRLNEPEMWEAYSYTTDTGQVVEQPAERNPRYLEGAARDFYEFLHDLLPGDQQQQIGTMTSEKPWILIGYSTGLTVLTTGAGMLLFRKKNLR